MTKKRAQIYQLKVSLRGARHPIWRRILVSSDTTLLQLHDIIQIAMGWCDCHLHSFSVDGKNYGRPLDDEFGDFGTLDETNFRLKQLISSEGQKLLYEYDFGDSWDHTILVEKILSPQEDMRYPVCIKGKRACPPEDVGGVWGYENFLEAIRDTNHQEHEEYLEWIGGQFDPEAFHLEIVNETLSSMKLRSGREDFPLWALEENEPEDAEPDEVLLWVESLSKTEQALAENLPFRRDMISLLEYVRDTKVTGTQSTGNFPLKAVSEICALFVEPIGMEKKIGETVFRVRSESEVWPLYFLHTLATVSGLITGGLSRRWKLTTVGENFLNIPAALQIWILGAHWWTEINWAIAAPRHFQKTDYPELFALAALKQLLELPVEESVKFQLFADELIKKASRVWSISDQEVARIILHHLIERTVIDPQLDFGILEATYQPHEMLGKAQQQLSTIKINSFGHGLLKTIQEVAFF